MKKIMRTRTGKKIRDLIFAMIICFFTSVIVCPVAFAAGSVIASGRCGEYSVWTVKESGDSYEMTISGSGEISGNNIWSTWDHYKSSVKYVEIESGLTAIGEKAFNGFTDMEEIRIPSGVERIGSSAFLNCRSLTEIKVPEKVTEIKENTFFGCSGLTTVSLPGGLLTIGKQSFKGCSSLNNILLPDGLTKIDEYAFDSCSSLKEILIPDTVDSIAINAFYNCGATLIVYYGSWAEAYAKNLSLNYKAICKAHVQADDYTIDKEPTCTEEGSKSKHCKNCSVLIENTITVIPKTNHKYGDWTVTKIPTCIEKGSRERVCEYCSNKDTEFFDVNSSIMDVKNYGHVLVKTEKVDPTCTEPGTEAYWTCSACKTLFSDQDAKTEIKEPVSIAAKGHSWSEWETTKEPTEKTTGEKQRICKNNASHIEKETIPVKKTEPETTSETETEAEQKKEPTAGSEIEPETKPETEPETEPETKPAAPAQKVSGTLLARMTAKGSKSLMLTWSKVKGAEGYDIFFTGCGTTLKDKVVKKMKGNETFTWTKKKLVKGKAYKAYVKAWVKNDGKKTYVKKSPSVHALTANGNQKYTNPKSITVQKKKITIEAGKSFTIKVKINKIDKTKSLLKDAHGPALRYRSSNTKIAAVSSEGKITAKTPGKCKVYVYAINGVSKTITVMVTAK